MVWRVAHFGQGPSETIYRFVVYKCLRRIIHLNLFIHVLCVCVCMNKGARLASLAPHRGWASGGATVTHFPIIMAAAAAAIIVDTFSVLRSFVNEEMKSDDERDERQRR